MITLLWVAPAFAVDRTFRIGHRVDFDNMDSPTFPVGDDYFRTNGVYRARQAKVTLYDETASIAVNAITDDDGEVVFPVTLGHTVHVRLHAEHYATTRPLRVRASAGGAVLTADSPSFVIQLIPAGSKQDVSFDAADPGQAWINLAAIGSWMIHRRPAAFPLGSTGANYDLVLGSDSVYDGDDAVSQTSYIDDQRPGFAVKRVIAHELAHQMQHWNAWVEYDALGGTGTVENAVAHDDLTYDDTSECTEFTGTHATVSKERQSGAIQEGMAEWVAAVMFNNTTQGDCRIAPGALTTWVIGSTGSFGAYSCEGYDDNDVGGVEWTEYGVDGLDYLGDTHDPLLGDPYTCLDEGDTVEVATELDWHRFLWDLTHTEGVPFASVFEAYAVAQPWNWVDPDPTLDPPNVQMREAFEVLDNGETWAGAWATQEQRNGVHR